MMRLAPSRRLAAALLLALSPALIAACGKRGKPEIPPGRESEFTYPRSYPDPGLVVPRTEANSEVDQRKPPGGRSVFSGDRNRTTVYSPIVGD